MKEVKDSVLRMLQRCQARESRRELTRVMGYRSYKYLSYNLVWQGVKRIRDWHISRTRKGEFLCWNLRIFDWFLVRSEQDGRRVVEYYSVDQQPLYPEEYMDEGLPSIRGLILEEGGLHLIDQDDWEHDWPEEGEEDNDDG